MDVAPSDFTMTAARAVVVDYLVPISEVHMRLLIKNPADSFNWLAFVNPLTWQVWAVMLLLALALPLPLAFAMKFGMTAIRMSELCINTPKVIEISISIRTHLMYVN